MSDPYSVWPTPLPARPRVLILAADLLARAGLAAILGQEPDLLVTGQAPLDGNLAPALAAFGPDVILCDLSNTGDESLDLLTDLGNEEAGSDQLAQPLLPRLPIVGLLADPSQATPAMHAALRGLLLRSAPPATLAAALRAAAAGLAVHDPRLVAPIAAVPTVDILDEPLTPREQEVLHLIAQGMPNKTIARTLQISEHTVKFHVNAILAKLGAQSRTEAVVRASRAGLVLL